jgi:hypothetical protein
MYRLMFRFPIGLQHLLDEELINLQQPFWERSCFGNLHADLQ